MPSAVMSWLNGVGDTVSTACDRKQDLSLSHQTKNVHVHRNETKQKLYGCQA